MKNFTLLLFAINVYFIQIYSQDTRLSINDPQSWGSSTKATISEASLNIRPHGTYLEYDLYLTFKSNWYTADSSRQLEAVLDFSLPAGSFITDSWLWVGDSIMKALLLDRSKATAIYEGIVNRRKDPSILVKNSNNTYQLRIYPIKSNLNRKVKISYMVPFSQKERIVTAPLPVHILTTSSIIPELKLSIYQGSNHTNPSIPESSEVVFSNEGEKYITTLTSNQVSKSYSIAFENINQNGIYLNTLKINKENFYQLAFNPSVLFNRESSRKIVIVIDYDYYYTTPYNIYYYSQYQKIGLNEMLDNTKSVILGELGANDSVNIFCNVNTPSNNSATWVSVTPENINALFEPLYTKLTQASKLSSLTKEAIDFCNPSDSTNAILIVSNADDYAGNSNASNTVIESIKEKMLDKPIPIHIVDCNSNNYSYYINDKYYYGNQYILQTISSMSRGSYAQYGLSNYYYYEVEFGYYKQSKPLSELISTAINLTEEPIPNFDFVFNTENGYCHSRYNVSDIRTIGINKQVIQLGKFEGTAPFILQVNAKFDSVAVSKKFTITSEQIDQAQIKTNKIWSGNYIMSIESIKNINNSNISSIVKASLDNRVLSKYTAFLALEPSDTVKACQDCNEDFMDGTNDYYDYEYNTGGSWAVSNPENITFDSSIISSAYPNPFVDQTSIHITFSDITEKLSIKIYSIQGQLIKNLYTNSSLHENVFSIDWDGNDDSNSKVAAGIYLVVIESDSARQVMKVMKQ